MENEKVQTGTLHLSQKVCASEAARPHPGLAYLDVGGWFSNPFTKGKSPVSAHTATHTRMHSFIQHKPQNGREVMTAIQNESQK